MKTEPILGFEKKCPVTGYHAAVSMTSLENKKYFKIKIISVVSQPGPSFPIVTEITTFGECIGHTIVNWAEQLN